ncbi:MAG TPA: response regulator [Dehalococcoidia bacterium]|nr:response regulator [Dehalococcoidia bacterium]
MEHILIVDDLASIRKIVYRKLVSEGYKCREVPDGDSALEAISEFEYDLVLLDVSMPGKSGIEVLREILAIYPDTSVIMVTSRDDAGTVIETMKMGACDYIIKPVNLSELPIRVRKALDRRKLVLENKEYRLHLEDKVKEQTEKIHEAFLNSITSLAFALEARDKYTSGHSQRVSKIALLICRRLGLKQSYTEKVTLAGLVHDIGKIGIKESILMKKEPLTDEEYSHIMAHSVIGEHILRPAINDEEILKIVRHHHERYNGTGYPDGLARQRIPLGARILAVADIYDAMTSDRPYRKAMKPNVAIDELKKQSRHMFDPVVVNAFFSIASGSPVAVPNRKRVAVKSRVSIK